MQLISSSIESEIAQYLRSDNKTEYFVSFVVVTGKETRICPVSARIQTVCNNDVAERIKSVNASMFSVVSNTNL